MASILRKPERSERVILFTLVDLLVQIIFFALFVLVLIQQSRPALPAAVQQQLSLYTRVAKAQLVEFIDAVSRMVPLSSVDKSRSIGDQDRGVRDRLAATSALIRSLSRLSTAQLQALSKFLSAPANAAQLTALMASLNGNSSKGATSQVQFHKLRDIFLAMTPNQRSALLAKAIEISKPRCFGGRAAFAAVEVPGGYMVSEPIREILPTFRVAVGARAATNATYLIGEGELDAFGDVLNKAYPHCNIFVSEQSETNDLAQYKHLNRYFLLE